MKLLLSRINISPKTTKHRRSRDPSSPQSIYSMKPWWAFMFSLIWKAGFLIKKRMVSLCSIKYFRKKSKLLSESKASSTYPSKTSLPYSAKWIYLVTMSPSVMIHVNSKSLVEIKKLGLAKFIFLSWLTGKLFSTLLDMTGTTITALSSSTLKPSMKTWFTKKNMDTKFLPNLTM